ncbi:hypothetical protein AXG93_4201s1370 [Marchantia polymorpha subsp. ruderalis]|uniref:Uncharacterized protein n=1 Tax=Marchantia polymorpha subsp. ruderalis TaxID=1480154 RepID=A0A176WDX7_MARPO|nr:hypothetical protein AXG93_4201s1370 [Marchantia polymorpha subsp. ruderalis]
MWRKKIHETASRPIAGEEGHCAIGAPDQEAQPKVMNMELQLINGISPVNSPRRPPKPPPPSQLIERTGANGIMMLSSTPTILIDISKAGVVPGSHEDQESEAQEQQLQQITSSSPRNAHFPNMSNSAHFSPQPWSSDALHIDEHWHYSHRSPWLRALVLGANDGLVSISSLMLGVGAVKNDVKAMIISGLAGLVAGAGSMAIGEFVSVFSQRDTELADLEKERQEHAKGPEAQARELEELTQIYVGRGLTYFLAKQVAVELSRVDVLKAHARDELGIDVDALSNPLQAALASSLAFSLGGGVPLLAVVVAVSSFALAAFGAAGARLGGAPMIRAALRVLIGGWLAMLLTYGILRLLGTYGFQ